jgi:hypothetical protein
MSDSPCYRQVRSEVAEKRTFRAQRVSFGLIVHEGSIRITSCKPSSRYRSRLNGRIDESTYHMRFSRSAAPSTRECKSSGIPGQCARLALCPAQSASRSDLPAFCAEGAKLRIRILCNG